MNVLLVVVDSLRASSLSLQGEGEPQTPFLRRLARDSVYFTRAHATECWTLPTHLSMFTGLLPSVHGAHFQNLAYGGTAPTIAEILAQDGYHTEVVTRNSIFEGSLPGVTRGFHANTRRLSQHLNFSAVLMALSKPRFRRQIAASGFFHQQQRSRADFVRVFARAMMPADELALDYTLEQLARRTKAGEDWFYFLNLYDVHAPYPPTETSVFRAVWPLEGLLENLQVPFVLPSLGAHRYLQPGFRLREGTRRMLLNRYLRAIELMDRKLERFHGEAQATGVLDDTLFILTSDHGEGFGEHGLYLHDASLYETHLHVPLFVQHPHGKAEKIADVVSTRHLFGLMRAASRGNVGSGTILDPDFRAQHRVAVAEHFYYPHAENMAPRYRQNLVAAVTAQRKVIVDGDGPRQYDLLEDPDEQRPCGPRR